MTADDNAGFSAWGPTADLDIAIFDAMFAGNVRAPFYLVAAFAPAMAARGKGSIINISSMAGRLGLPGGAAYGATKRSEEHTSELQSRLHLVCRLLLEKKKQQRQKKMNSTDK